ncbi:F-box/LRR-repeat protein 18-like [Lethenteron reissneri]|uniref:F-box/LRR-repeat protein 18-like n=1 Tax=Lethenteron reissneri TaxID=7753 RepID=UPI002AB5F1AC|nr:F-box/LRR-repeat protein 18-like [Lethenteron reissneri]
MEVDIPGRSCSSSSSSEGPSLMGLSDEVLLHVLSFVPCPDLLGSVRKVNQKLRALSVDRSLLADIKLSGVYQVTDQDVREILECARPGVQNLDLGGCYWLSANVLDAVCRCRSLVRLDVTGCALTATRLDRILGGAPALASLAIDVRPGFDAARLGAEARAALARITELRQTLLTPSYGVVPCCVAVRTLLLRLEIPDCDEVGGALPPAQLMVGQSNIPCYRHLRVFAVRLAPGFSNQDVARIYLSSLPSRPPSGIETFVLSVPCGFPELTPWMSGFLSAVAESDDLASLQLPRSWLAEGSALRSVRLRRPRHLILPRCSLRSLDLAHMLALPAPGPARGDGDDGARAADREDEGHGNDDDGDHDGDAASPARSLVTLNLSGFAFGRFGVQRPEQASVAFLDALTRVCRRGLRSLNLAGAHVHLPLSPPAPGQLCRALSRLRRLRSLALPLCAVSSSSPAGHAPAGGRAPAVYVRRRGPSLRSGGDAAGSAEQRAEPPRAAPEMPARGFDKKMRVMRTAPLTAAEAPAVALLGVAGDPADAGPFAGLVSRLPQLRELELVSSNFVSALPRFEMANQQVRHCGHGTAFGDAEMALIGQLPNLRRLTVAQAPEVVTGTGLVALARGCRHLQELSLANIGKPAHATYLPALCQALALCQRLHSFRLEQPYVSAGATFFRALLRCPELQRLCVVSRGGGLPEPDVALHFVAASPHLVVCHLFTGDTRVTCKELQKAIMRSVCPSRPALSVAVFPLMHDLLGEVIRSLPLSHLDDFTLFRSHVAQEPPGLWH